MFKMVEIEINSKCNRTCSWCPNSFIDRKNNSVDLEEENYLKVFEELKEIGFEGVVSFSRNNEPMAYPDLLKKRVSQAKEICPKCLFVTNTNGDYLTNENLDGLLIDELSIMDYNSNGVKWALKRLLKLKCIIDEVDGNFIYARRGDMKIVYACNWKEQWDSENALNSKGGLLKEYELVKRTEPCFEPRDFIAIDYNGNVMPCCHMRSDIEEHEEFILGNIKDDKILDIYKSNKSVKFRMEVMSANFEGKSPCTYCNKKPGRYIRESEPGIKW